MDDCVTSTSLLLNNLMFFLELGSECLIFVSSVLSSCLYSFSKG